MLEIDFGLNLHLSDVGTEVNEPLLTIANFAAPVDLSVVKASATDNVKVSSNS